MKHALDNSRAVQIYKQYVDAFGLGYEVKDEERLDLLLQPVGLFHTVLHEFRGVG